MITSLKTAACCQAIGMLHLLSNSDIRDEHFEVGGSGKNGYVRWPLTHGAQSQNKREAQENLSKSSMPLRDIIRPRP